MKERSRTASCGGKVKLLRQDSCELEAGCAVAGARAVLQLLKRFAESEEVGSDIGIGRRDMQGRVSSVGGAWCHAIIAASCIWFRALLAPMHPAAS